MSLCFHGGYWLPAFLNFKFRSLFFCSLLFSLSLSRIALRFADVVLSLFLVQCPTRTMYTFHYTFLCLSSSALVSSQLVLFTAVVSLPRNGQLNSDKQSATATGRETIKLGTISYGNGRQPNALLTIFHSEKTDFPKMRMHIFE